jgi:hypothetical protein
LAKENDNLDLIFLVGCLALIVAAIAITLANSNDLFPETKNVNLPGWVNLSGDENSLTLRYDATNVKDFQGMKVTCTWLDSKTGETRILYESSSKEVSHAFEIPYLINPNSPTMTVDAAAEVSSGGESGRTFHYLYGVTHNMYTKPTIEFLR